MTVTFPKAKRGLSTGAIVAIVAGGVVLILVAVAGVIAFNLIRGTMRFTISGVNMEPTVRAGQTVSATRVDAGEYQPERGDIVVFKAPVQWSNKADDMFVMRVIGLPGERVGCCDSSGRLTVGGAPLDEPYLKGPSTPAGTEFLIEVPPNRLWVMGDNRTRSGDSLQNFMNSGDIETGTIKLSAVVAIVKR